MPKQAAVTGQVNGNAPLSAYDQPVPDGVVRVLTLDRPAQRNALDTALLTALEQALTAADSDPTVRAVVLAAQGPVFCSGGDTKEFRDTSDAVAAMASRANLMGRVLALIPAMATPVISAVRGPAVGGGAALALASDMTIVSDDHYLTFPELGDGSVPAVVMPWVLRLFGRKLAFELLTTPRQLWANDALLLGAINRVVAPNLVVSTALEIAEAWGPIPPPTMGETKRLFRLVEELSLDEGINAGVDVTVSTWSPGG